MMECRFGRGSRLGRMIRFRRINEILNPGRKREEGEIEVDEISPMM
jgi:hypothetical protein